MSEPILQTLGRYTLRAEIGRGGFATVYRALDTPLDREVALKVLKPAWTDDPQAVARFMREARQAARLKHPNIVTIYDVGQAEGRLFIAMELVPGRSLQQVIAEDGPMPWERAVAVLEQAAAALDYAHKQGLVHRDVKPANIILNESEPGLHAMLTDFGLVRGAEQASLTTGSTGGIIGTPEYIAPEIWDGQTATPSSDVYALACVGYYMLTGQVLFGAATPMAVLKRHMEGPVLPKEWPAGVPQSIADVLQQALAREPDRRLATASQLIARLRECKAQEAKGKVQEIDEARKVEAASLAREEQLRQAREAARRAEEDARRKELEQREERERQMRAAQVRMQKPVVAPPVSSPIPRPAQQPVPARRQGISIWVWLGGGVVLFACIASIVVVLVPIIFPPATPTRAPAPTKAPITVAPTGATVKPTSRPVTVAPTIATVKPTSGPVQPTASPSKLADTIVLALQSEPDALHPFASSMFASAIVNGALMPGCLRQNEKTEWIALGCESVPTLENGWAKLVGDGADRHLEVTYKIRKGWRWTDGAPVTAKDAVYAWKLLMDPDFEAVDRSKAEKIYDLAAVDDLTVLMKLMSETQAKSAAAGTLKSSTVPFDKFIDDYKGYADQQGPVVDPVYWNIFPGWLPSHVLSKIPAKEQIKSDYARNPLGDGAYVLKEWKAGEAITLEKSDKPFPLGDAKTKTIVFRFFQDSSAMLAALQKAEVDATTGDAGLNYTYAPDLAKLDGTKYKVTWQPGYSWEHIDLNTTKLPLDDVRVRRALYYALDKKALIEQVFNGRHVVAELPGGILPTNSWAYTGNYTRYSFDVATAKKLLAEAGWDCSKIPCASGNRKLEFTLATTDRADRQALASAIQQQWKAINVGVNLQFLAGRGLFATCSAGGPLYCRSFDAAIYTWVGDGEPQFLDLYGCDAIPTKENGYSGQNTPGYCNTDADATLKLSERTADYVLSRDKRKPYLEKFFQLWTTDVPVIPLYISATPYVYRTGFKNYKPGLSYATTDAWNAWEWELTK